MKNKILWGLQIVTALAFLAAAGAKLAGSSEMVVVFEKIGIGQWFRYVTGISEAAGAILLLSPRLSGFGAALLAWVMFCATLTHLFIIGGNPAPAVVLLALSLAIASQRFMPQWRAITRSAGGDQPALQRQSAATKEAEASSL